MTHQTANFNNFLHDSNQSTRPTSGRQRIGISASEIELLDDVPLAMENASKSKGNASAGSPGPKKDSSRIIYANPHDEELGNAVDRLLERYAPDALPSNLHETATTRRPVSRQDPRTTIDEAPRSTFQTTSPAPAPVPTPPSSTSTHQYSTIVRPNRGAAAPSPADYSAQATQPPPAKPRPVTNYDSFQHVVPQTQQSAAAAIPLQLKNGNVPPIVPGQLYTLDDDPLDFIYDRQPPPRPPPLSKQAKTTFPSTFQPPSRPDNAQDPLAVLFPHLVHGNTSTMTGLAPAPPTTTTAAAPAPHGFDLGNLIKQVQQDYYQQIQPFVSSVKFIDKDHQLGQTLADVNFSTPVTVPKGFLGKADDLLRRSFGRQDGARRVPEKKSDGKSEMYSDEEDDRIRDLPSKSHYTHLQKHDSKASTFSSLTSSTGMADDDDDDDDDLSDGSESVRVVDQSTSPPPTEGSKKTFSDFEQKPNQTTSKIDDSARSTPRATGPTPARRIPSDESSHSSLASEEEESEEEESTSKPLTTPSAAVAAVATAVPIAKPDEEVVRRRSKELQANTLKSEDIHPKPPIIKSDAPSEKPPPMLEDESGSEDGTGSEYETDSDDDAPVTNTRHAPPNFSAAAPAPAPAATNSRFAAPAATSATPTRGSEPAAATNSRFAAPAAPTRDAEAPAPAAATNSRFAAPAAPTRDAEAPAPAAATNSRFAAPAAPARDSEAPAAAPATNSRFSAATPAASTTPAAAAATNSRFPAAATPAVGATTSNTRGEPSANPNLPFVSPDRRVPSTTPTGQPPATPQATSQPQPQSGSARLFSSTNESKSTRPASNTARQSSFRDKLKGFKSRFLGK